MLNNIKKDYNEESIKAHLKTGGKLSSSTKLSIKNKEDLSIAYSPGVGAVTLEIFKGEDEIAKHNLSLQYTLKRNTVAIISDGSAILGLGNLGSYAAIPVMEGKAVILKEFADVDAFPICIQTQDEEEIIKVIKNIAPVFGGINLEDIAAPKCFYIEQRLRQELNIPVMHDDQWGAATATLAGLINSLKLAKKSKENIKVVLSGVGAAGVATARLLLLYGIKNLILVDSKGIINIYRDDLTKEKTELLAMIDKKDTKGDLAEALKYADVFIGLSKPNILKEHMIKSMNDKPIIFALANPEPEISPQEAYQYGAFIIGTGRSDYPNQINNSLVFPGFWRGVLNAQYNGNYKKLDNHIFVEIAESIANIIKQEDLDIHNILPDMFNKELVEIVSQCIYKK